MIILGIETSCDETAVALIEKRGDFNIDRSKDTLEFRIITSLIHSQAELHSQYGGVYPNLAKREHSRNIVWLLEKALSKANLAGKSLSNSSTEKNPIKSSTDIQTIEKKLIKSWLAELEKEIGKNNADLLAELEKAKFLQSKLPIDYIAVTEGPGLEPALWVGINFAKAIGKLWNIPVIPINHMEGHVIGSLLKDDTSKEWQKPTYLELPALSLLISGGHTELVLLENDKQEKNQLGKIQNGKMINNLQKSAATSSWSYEIVGETKDDALGEAFDKVARLLGLPYPGGINLSLLAEKARKENMKSQLKLPRPMINSGDLNFSFSGLKTAVLYAIQKAEKVGVFDDNYKAGLAREFEDSITEVITDKTEKAILKYGPKILTIGGGVSANINIRKALLDLAEKKGLEILLPTKHISGDNALMIALALGYHLNIDQKEIISPTAHGTKRLT